MPEKQSNAAATSRSALLLVEDERRSRRAEGFLSQVLQRRRNHETFSIKFVTQEEHPELIERFQITSTPTIVVVDQERFKGGSSSRVAATRSRPFWRPG